MQQAKILMQSPFSFSSSHSHPCIAFHLPLIRVLLSISLSSVYCFPSPSHPCIAFHLPLIRVLLSISLSSSSLLLLLSSPTTTAVSLSVANFLFLCYSHALFLFLTGAVDNSHWRHHLLRPRRLEFLGKVEVDCWKFISLSIHWLNERLLTSLT